jgi:hypothetical protein
MNQYAKEISFTARVPVTQHAPIRIRVPCSR